MRTEKKIFVAWRLHRLINAINQIVFEMDVDGYWTFLNDAWQVQTGHTVQDCIGDNFLDYMHEEDRPAGERLMRWLLKKGDDPLQLPLRIRCHDGRYRWFELYAQQSHSDDGHVYGITGSMSDITQQKILQDQILAQRQSWTEDVEQHTEDLRRHLRQEKGLTAVSQALFSGASDALPQALQHLRAALGVGRVCLYENVYDSAGDRFARLRYESCASEATGDLQGAGLLEIRYEERGLGRWPEAFGEGEAITAEVEALSEPERALHEQLGVRAMMALPVLVQEQWTGFLAFHDLQDARQWDGNSEQLMRVAADMIGAFLTQQRLEQQIEESRKRRERQMALTTKLSERISNANSLGELFQWFVEDVARAFGYSHAHLLAYSSSSEVAELVAAFGESAGTLLSEGYRLGSGQGVAGRALDTGQAILEPILVSQDKRELPPSLGEAKGALAVPIRLGRELKGILAVYVDSEGTLDRQDVFMLNSFSGQLATAVESWELRDEMEDRLAELDNLQRLMSREAWLRIKDSGNEGVRGYRFDRRTMQAIRPDDVRPSPEGEENGSGPQESRPTVTSPLQLRGQKFGILGVEDDPRNPLKPEEREFVEEISQQVSEAMEHARLLEQTQKRAVELETVSRVSAATSTILEAEKLLTAVVELARRSFDLYHAHIYLLDEESGRLMLTAGSGEAGPKLVEQGWGIDVDHPRSVVARAARQREGIIVNDVQDKSGYLPNPLLPNTRSELAVPMIVGNRLLGVLDVQAEKADYFTEDDVRIQTALANQVGIALQNAMLYQEQLETAEMLREFDRLKSEFLASMSHELRTPLNSIIGFADVLLEGIDGELNERMEEDVNLIRNSGQHLRELIGDILDMSKIEAGMMDLRYEEIDLRDMERDFEAFARTQLMTYDKELEIEVEINPSVDVIEADATRFKQVLYNLISNAIKFTEEGQVTLSLEKQDDHILVQVSDTGIGIKEEDLPLIFEQFRQVDGSLTRSAGGTGLGLPISKSLVELHGGEIWVESEVGEGTTFSFTIPEEKPKRRRRSTNMIAPRPDEHPPADEEESEGN